MHEIGLTRQMGLSGPIVNDTDLWAAGPDTAFGTFPKLWNYTGPHITKRSADFSAAYQKKYGQPPEVEGWQNWFGTAAILTAIKETKATDSAKLVAFLEEHKFDGCLRSRHCGCRHRRRSCRAALERGAIDVRGGDHASLRRGHDRRPRALRGSRDEWAPGRCVGCTIDPVLMIVVLLVRPRGLLGESWERFE
jgi:hypothetical protein